MSLNARSASRQSGFTLVELMMVVVILGILAVVAIPKYISYVMKSKTSEAVGFLGEIKARQEAYRADFGQYCDVSAGNIATYYPTGTLSDVPLTWPATPSNQTGTNFRQLGAVPAGNSTLFHYSSAAGVPGALPTWVSNLGYSGADFWFVSRAQADLDNDTVLVTFESYSHGPGIYIDKASGWE